MQIKLLKTHTHKVIERAVGYMHRVHREAHSITCTTLQFTIIWHYTALGIAPLRKAVYFSGNSPYKYYAPSVQHLSVKILKPMQEKKSVFLDSLTVLLQHPASMAPSWPLERGSPYTPALLLLCHQLHLYCADIYTAVLVNSSNSLSLQTLLDISLFALGMSLTVIIEVFSSNNNLSLQKKNISPNLLHASSTHPELKLLGTRIFIGMGLKF